MNNFCASFVSIVALCATLTADSTQTSTQDSTQSSQIRVQMPRKGAVATLLKNATAYDEICKIKNAKVREEKISALVIEQKVLNHTLYRLGLFEFFTPEEWLRGNKKKQEGRAFVACVYLEDHPDQVSRVVYKVLKKQKGKVSKELETRMQALMAIYEETSTSSSSSGSSSSSSSSSFSSLSSSSSL